MAHEIGLIFEPSRLNNKRPSVTNLIRKLRKLELSLKSVIDCVKNQKNSLNCILK
jgi:hypothetical protein